MAVCLISEVIMHGVHAVLYRDQVSLRWWREPQLPRVDINPRSFHSTVCSLFIAVPGTIPKELGRLGALKSLHIASNKLSGMACERRESNLWASLVPVASLLQQPECV